MRFARLALAGLLALVGCKGTPADDGTDGVEGDAPEIVGGVLDKDDPAVVAIALVGTGFAVCSGTLIAPNVVLTAGHCPQTGIWVRQGSDVRGALWLSHVGVKDTARHPGFSGEGKHYDVSLLHLDESIPNVKPAVLSTAALSDKDVGVDIRHVGFGTTGDDWNYIKQIATGGLKRQITYPITKVDDFFVYSGGPGQQTCIFDSGGPAFRGDELIAIVSAGDDCHSTGWDTRIDRTDILEWIDRQMWNWGTHRPE